MAKAKKAATMKARVQVSIARAGEFNIDIEIDEALLKADRAQVESVAREAVLARLKVKVENVGDLVKRLKAQAKAS